MTDEFVIPLGLTDTSFPDQGSDQTIPGPFVDSWAWVEGQSYNLTEQNMSANVGEGNMITSARDMSKFYQLLLKGEARVDIAHVSKYMMDCRLISPISTVGYGPGLFHYVNLGFGHGGDGAGFTVRCFTDPYSEFTVLGFFNCWNYKEGLGDRSYFNETDELLWNLLYRVKVEIAGY